mgnify:FL=1
MELKEYQELAARTINKDASATDNLLNACLGLAGEVGEFNDLVKKWLFHGHTLDIDKCVKELGDTLWYIPQAIGALKKLAEDRQSYAGMAVFNLTNTIPASDLTLEGVARINIEKLEKRYKDGFSSQASINRAE